MRAVDIIQKKREGQSLTTGEIRYFIRGCVEGEIPDYQVSAWLMAVCINGMDNRETTDLTMAMVDSGEKVDLSGVKGVKVDKHSTGGVGDTTTLIVAPLVAACGVPVAKMSGRGLGFTGGTLDKLESIPGFRVSLSMGEFLQSVQSVGLAVIGQSRNLVPADQLLYALRDVTGTVESIPLIASSIMSKKIAAGTDAIVLDVKTGSGAFMQSVEDSFALAEEMVKIGTRAGRKTTAVVTDMDQPLGMAVGNALEVREAVEVLQGRQKGPLREVSLYLAATMLMTANGCDTLKDGRRKAEEALVSGRGLARLGDMIRRQHGDAGVLEDFSRLPRANRILPIKAEKEGCITSVDTREIGRCALLLGAGRSRKGDRIDPGVGLVLHRRIGDRIRPGDLLAEFYVNREEELQEAVENFRKAVRIGTDKPTPRPLILGSVTASGVDHTPVYAE